MLKKELIAATVGALPVLAGAGLYEASVYHQRLAPPSSVSVARALGRFDVDPSGIKPGTPNFRDAETARAAHGSGSTGVWQVPHHAKKVFVPHQPGQLVRLWRKVSSAGA